MKSINKILFPLIVLFANNVHANIEVSDIVLDKLGAGICRISYRPLTKSEAETNRSALLNRMGKWQITSLDDGWVITGSGYNGHIKKAPSRETFCYPQDIEVNSVFAQTINTKFFKITEGKVDLSSQTDLKKIDLNSLKDGIYLVDKGQGWIRGEQDFIAKDIALPNKYATLKIFKDLPNSHQVAIAGGIDVPTSGIESMINQAYGHSLPITKRVSASYAFPAPSDLNVYVRTYATHQRFDTIGIKNSQLVEHKITFIPSGTMGKKLYFATGYLNEDSFLENGARRVTDRVEPISNFSADNQADSSNDDFDFNFDEVQSIVHIDDNGHANDSINPIDFEQSLSGSGQRNSPHSDLTDGFYLIDQGNSWFREDDEGVINTLFTESSSSVFYEDKVTISPNLSINYSLAKSLQNGFVVKLLEMIHGTGWWQSYTTDLMTPIYSNVAKSAFSKVYTVNYRSDVIEIRNGKLVSQTVAYKPNSIKSDNIYFDASLGYDQSQNYKYESKPLALAKAND